MSWEEPRRVSRVLLFDRPNTDDQITGGTLTFSDGTVGLGALPNGGSTPLEVGPIVHETTSLKMTVTSTSGSTFNVGLSEILVYGE